MSYQQELKSWLSPPHISTSAIPIRGSRAPTTAKLQLPQSNKKPTVLTFLRHCGCPFAEKTFRNLRTEAAKETSVSFIAVSHSSSASTEKWLEAIGGSGNVHVIVDPERELYSQWGLGVSGWRHVLSPGGLWSAYTLGKEEGIWNRPTESGSRWQTAGSFAVDAQGTVRWGGVADRADEIPDFDDAIKALEEGNEGQRAKP